MTPEERDIGRESVSPRSEEAIAEEKAAAAWLLARFVPFSVWLGEAPRTDGDVWMYFSISRNLHYRLEHGEDPPPAPADPDTDRPMALHAHCWNDVECYFRFDDDSTGASRA